METDEENLKCSICGKSFKLKIHLDKHNRIQHLKLDATTCSTCNKTFLDKSAFGRHILIHRADGERNFPCTECTKDFTTKYYLTSHKKNVHTESNKVNCDGCGLKINKMKLGEHKKSHNSKFKCEYCPKVVKRRGELKNHIRVHHFICKEKFDCDQCDKTFKQREYLLKHVRYIHKKSEENKWKCDICGKFFAQYGSLSVHKKIHIGKKIDCNDCERKFIRKDCLRQHIKRTHSVERSFNCQLCDKAYKTKQDLASHMASHSDLRPFKCQKCNITSKYKDNMQKHVKTCKREQILK